ncbi:MAG: hypothetical protein Q4A46_07075 [Clostridia bacterium]|nr:hypothetical protein [Clostridia bacterium]
MNEHENYNYETDFDALLEFLNSLPKPEIKLLNFKRYREMMQSAQNLQQVFPNANINAEINQYFNLGSISVEIPDLSAMNLQKFSITINKANNFEIYPLTNGNLRLDVTFQNIINGYYGEEHS